MLRVATGGLQKRVQQSPFAKIGVTPPSKHLHPVTTSMIMKPPLQSLTHSLSIIQQSSNTSVTPPHKCPSPSTTSVMRRPLQPLAPKQTIVVPLPLHRAGTQPIRRELFPRPSLMSTTTRGQLVQEEIKIPVYTDIESETSK